MSCFIGDIGQVTNPLMINVTLYAETISSCMEQQPQLFTPNLETDQELCNREAGHTCMKSCSNTIRKIRKFLPCHDVNLLVLKHETTLNLLGSGKSRRRVYQAAIYIHSTCTCEVPLSARAD